MLEGKRRDVLKGLATCLAASALPAGMLAAPAVHASRVRIDGIRDPASPLSTLFKGGRWLEGPCFLPKSRSLVFSDVRSNRMWRLGEDAAARIFRDPSNNANGNVLDAEGRLVTCEHRRRRVVRQEADGSTTVLADRFEGKRLNAPNDAVLAPDGAIWFTDPTYGITKADEGIVAEPEQGARRVYRIDASGRLDAMTDALEQPNGIAISPDGRTLYVSETGSGVRPNVRNGIVAFRIDARRGLSDRHDLVPYDEGAADGLALDVDGRLYAASGDGVRIFEPDGLFLGLIPTPKTAANLTFGGPDGRRLFITATDALHAVDLEVAGIEWRG